MRAEIRESHRDGFTLAAVLVVMAAMLLMAVGVLAVVGIERKTARSYLDAKRAEWVARAGMEDVRGLLREQTANDDYLILSKSLETGDTSKEDLDYLYLARGMGGGTDVSYDLIPLFSSNAGRETVTDLRELPEPNTGTGNSPLEVEVLPWADEASVAWIPVEDEEGRMVGRYGYWVEDLQGRLDLNGEGSAWDDEMLARVEWPSPAAAVKLEPEGPGVEMALHVLDPDLEGDEDSSDLDDKLIEGRPVMLSPNSTLAAAGFEAPLERNETGGLVDLKADAVERHTINELYPYTEQALIPFSPGIDEAVAGRPKLNLNELLVKPRSQAIDEFKQQIEDALPEFEERRGAFPDDYLGTLAAGAFDYADADNDATIEAGIRGLDGYPLLSEIFLQIHFRGLELTDDRKYLLWTMKLYAEVWNMTDKEVSGEVQVSYENGLSTTGIGALPQGQRFDDPIIMNNPERATHSLVEIDGRFWSPPLQMSLQPDQYETREFASVEYRLDVGPRSGPGSVFITSFSLIEPMGASGISLRWNSEDVDRVDKIIRYSVGSSEADFNFNAERAKYVTKAAISGHSFGPYGDFVNNMGDPRIANYIRSPRWPLGLNAYPENASPNRRNIRRGTIYDRDTKSKRSTYGRVLPSEWPDGGHDSDVGTWSVSGNDSTSPVSSALIGKPPTPEVENAVQRLSNEGRFFSAAELGRVFDPVMWWPTYSDLDGDSGSGRDDTETLAPIPPKRGGNMPSGRDRWPRVALESYPSDMHGGGNTLAIGSIEHPRFDNPEQHAARLLDLFHVGIPQSDDQEEREGPVINVDGKVNLNTASEDVLRVLAAGNLKQDPKLSRVLRDDHRGAPQMRRWTKEIDLGTPTRERAADLVAEAIVESRPFTSAYDLARIREYLGDPDDESAPKVFGNREMYSLGDEIEWNDAAAEELFARMYEGTTVRSRNFRVWVVGQAVAPLAAGSTVEPVVLAESRKVFTVFADPGERNDVGEIDELNYYPQIKHENDF
ncbi:type IV pilus modification PilV family protein [Haloferula sp.]|uniref:type IV pilus modification PilV family protein n=1 Tax=Haloferula sp. TaxID=2497595 RepID=UPI003C74ACFA